MNQCDFFYWGPSQHHLHSTTGGRQLETFACFWIDFNFSFHSHLSSGRAQVSSHSWSQVKNENKWADDFVTWPSLTTSGMEELVAQLNSELLDTTDLYNQMGEQTAVLICCISQEECPGITGPPSDRKRSLWVEERGQKPEDAGRHMRFEWYRCYWGLAIHHAQGTHTPFTTVLFILAAYQSQVQRKLNHLLETFDSDSFSSRFSPVYWYKKVLCEGYSSSSWANILTLIWPVCFYFLRSPESSLSGQGSDANTGTNQAYCKFHRRFQRWRWARLPAFGLSRLSLTRPFLRKRGCVVNFPFDLSYERAAKRAGGKKQTAEHSATAAPRSPRKWLFEE